MKNLIFIFIVSILAACSPATQITGSWKSPSPPQNPIAYQSVMIVSMSQNLQARQTVENDLAAAISSSGVQARKGIEAFPPTISDSNEADKHNMLHKIRETGVQGIVTIALIKEETENRYVPGNYGYAPVSRFHYYGMFTGYYTNWYPTMYSPGYYQQDKVYFMEVNFYDAKSEELIWSAQSQTYNPGSLPQFSKDFSRVIANQMKKDGVLR